MKIAILTNIIPSYREGFYDNLFYDKDYNISIYCQQINSKNGFKGLHDKYKPKLKEVKYISLVRNKFVWHILPFREIWKNNDIFVLDGNLRHLSMALFSTILRLSGKKVVIWSVAYSRNNYTFFTKLRLFWWKIFDYFLMYTSCDIQNLKKEGYKNKVIISVNNGLNQERINNIQTKWPERRIEEFQIEKEISNKKIVVSIGRLVSGRFDLMIDAIEYLKKDIPNILWILIGSGEGESELKQKIQEKGLTQNIKLTGAIYEEEKIAPWLMSAKVYVHPAPIGLSLFHAFGYRLPVITTDNILYQGPEFCAFEDNQTGLLYKDGDARSLAQKCKNLLNREFDTEKIESIVENEHNTEIMTQQFKKMIALISKS